MPEPTKAIGPQSPAPSPRTRIDTRLKTAITLCDYVEM